MILTDERVTVQYDVMTALSRLHSRGALYPTSDHIAAEACHESREVRTTLQDMEGMGWVSFSLGRSGWRISEGVLSCVVRIQYCDVCRNFDHEEVRAIAECRMPSGNWAYVCGRHFIAEDCRLGSGFGQILRFEY